MDFSINIYLGLKAIHDAMHKTKSKEEIQECIDELVLTERIETVVPLTYMIIVTLTYFSPNAPIMMGMRLSLWHNVAITDLEGFLHTLGLLFCVDLSSFVLNGILLKWFLGVNIIENLKRIQKQFWVIMCWEDASSFLEVIFHIVATSIG